MAGLKPSWKHGQQHPAIIVEMSFKNFMYAENDDDLYFLPKEPSADFGTGSLSVSINTKPPVVEAAPIDQPAENTTDSEVLILIFSDDDAGLSDCLELENANACYLKVPAITPPAWKNHLDNQLDIEFLDLHERCYARQAVVDNAVNRRSRELLKVINQIRAECDVLKDKEKARDQECEELKAGTDI
ncbi:hypothetical protein Tco_0790888 [Tanacetum coccineum]